jgi:hypothetical protein
VHIVAGVDRCIVHFWRTAKPGGELPGTWRQETLPQPAWSTRTPQRLTAGWSGSQLDVYGIMPEVEGSVAVHCVKDELAGDWGPWGLVGEGGAPGMKQIVIPAENLYGGSNGLLTEVAGLQTRDGSILTAPLYALASDSGKASQE